MKFLKLALLSSSLLLGQALSVGLAHAGTFSVTPVRIFLQPRDRATAVTFVNEGDSEVVLQADVYDWAQLPNGEDDLKLTEDLIISPPIIKIAPGGKQVVRLARLSMAPNTSQQTFRLISREIPEIAAAKTGVKVQIALALSMPVFVTPANAKPVMDCSTAKLVGDKVTIDCKNTGNSHAQIRVARLLRDGAEAGKLENGGYYLAGSQRVFSITQPGFKTGPVSLELQLDDGTSPTFNLTVSP